jgi:hypothetical protein
MQFRSTLWLMCSAALALGACKKSAPAAQAGPTVITVSAMDFAFAAPETVPAGLVTFQLVGSGKEPHQMVVMRIDSGKTMADVQPVLTSTDMGIPGWLKFPIGVSVIAPGDTGNATALLTPGHYAMACFVPSPDGTAHVAKGMMRTFEVAPNEATPAPEPAADITITEKDYDFDVTGNLTAGAHTIRVENAGPQLHEVAMSQLAPGKTLADFQAWAQGGMKGEPPAKPVGGVTGPDVGGHQTFTANLAAGTYVLMCLVPDNKDGKPHLMHGMIKEITIS